MPTNKLLSVLESATPADLQEIRDEIATLSSRMTALRDLERVLLRRFPEAAPQSADGTEDPRLPKIHDLLTTRGPLKAGDIAAAFGMTPRAVGILCSRSPWFHQRSDKRYEIATTSATR